jgi:hypothetical protein
LRQCLAIVGAAAYGSVQAETVDVGVPSPQRRPSMKMTTSVLTWPWSSST